MYSGFRAVHRKQIYNSKFLRSRAQMSKRLLVFLFAGIIAFALTPTAWGVCTVTITTSIPPDPAPATSPSGQLVPVVAPAAGATLNQEGDTERVSDVLITDNLVGVG